MDRHWTLDLVAVSGICAGFVLFLTGYEPMAGVVTAASAYAVLVPELASDRRDGAGGQRRLPDPEGAESPAVETGRRNTVR